MKLSLFGRLAMALFASLALGLGMTACGGGTIGYMWVLGTQYNQIAGFKIDDYTGNLTQVPGAPFASNGAVPVSILVKPGGRYVYVINQGSGGTTAAKGAGASIAVYSVGGDGILTFQQAYQTQGYISQWAQFDSTGGYLYVLDKYAPSYVASTGLWNGPNTDGNGAITAFQIDSSTGRLFLVTNSQTQLNGVNTPFWEVGPNPFMMESLGGCLFTANKGDQSISPFSFGSSGQLTYTQTQRYQAQTTNVTSITGGGSFLFLTDAGATPGTTNGSIRGYTIGSGCAPTLLQGGGVTNNPPGSFDPVYTFIDSTSKYLYVLNATTTSTQPTQSYSSILAYTINTTNNQLQQIAGSPYSVGSGPVCMVEDPTHQYMYISNHNDGTVTGKLLDPTTGILSDLPRGSTFPSVGLAGCLVVSGAVN